MNNHLARLRSPVGVAVALLFLISACGLTVSSAEESGSGTVTSDPTSSSEPTDPGDEDTEDGGEMDSGEQEVDEAEDQSLPEVDEQVEGEAEPSPEADDQTDEENDEPMAEDGFDDTPAIPDELLGIPDELTDTLGEPFEDFEVLANDLGFVVRISTLDGESLALTLDLNPRRLNVEVADGRVVGIDSIG